MVSAWCTYGTWFMWYSRPIHIYIYINVYTYRINTYITSIYYFNLNIYIYIYVKSVSTLILRKMKWRLINIIDDSTGKQGHVAAPARILGLRGETTKATHDSLPFPMGNGWGSRLDAMYFWRECSPRWFPNTVFEILS